MFLVFNKEKISAYIVSILTVCFLFFIASTIPAKENATPTSTNIANSNENNINNLINTTITINNNINTQNMNNEVNKGNTMQ